MPNHCEKDWLKSFFSFQPAKNDFVWLFVWLILLVAIGLRVKELAVKEVGVDEAVTIEQSQMSWPQLIETLQFKDPTPPLYPVIAKFLHDLGGFMAVKMFSVLCGFLLVFFSFLLAKDLFKSDAIALIAMLLVAVNPLAVAFSQQMRSGAFFALLFTVLLVVWVRGKWQNRASYGIGFLNILMILTHYHGFIVCGCEMLFLAWLFLQKKVSKGFVARVFVLTLLVLPISWFFLQSQLFIVGEKGYAMRGLFDLGYVFCKFMAGVNISSLDLSALTFFSVAGVLLVGVAFLCGLYNLYNLNNRADLLFFFFFLPLLGTFLVAQFFPVLFYFRYFFYLLPLFCVVCAGAFDKPKPDLFFFLIIVAFWLYVLWAFYYPAILLPEWNAVFGI